MTYLKNSFCFIEKERGDNRIAIRKYGIPKAYQDCGPGDTIALIVKKYDEIGCVPDEKYTTAADCYKCRHRLLCLLNPLATVRFQPRSEEYKR